MVIANIAEQGGVGKTTLCFNISWYLASRGKKVLLIDTDPQYCNLSETAGVKNKESLPSIYNAIIGECKIQDTIVKLMDNLDIIPANEYTAELLRLLYTEDDGAFAMKNIISSIVNNYDFIFIDVPSFPTCHLMPLVASDYVIIPCKPDAKTIKSTKATIQSYMKVKNVLNPKIEVLAAVENAYSNRRENTKDASLSAVEIMCRMLNIRFADTKIALNTELGKTLMHFKGVTEASPKSTGSKSIIKLCNELFDI